MGSVIATKGAIIPAAVGVDIGRSMAAQRATLLDSDFSGICDGKTMICSVIIR